MSSCVSPECVGMNGALNIRQVITIAKGLVGLAPCNVTFTNSTLFQASSPPVVALVALAHLHHTYPPQYFDISLTSTALLLEQD